MVKTGFAEFPPGAKCQRCRTLPHIRLPSHHMNLCRDCFLHYVHTAVARAMKKFPLQPDTPLMVAVSGGKDSLAVWQILHELGYPTEGLHLDLGLNGFSEASLQAVSRFAEARNLPWQSHSLQEQFGQRLPELRRGIRRKTCSVCGLLKRQLLNRLTVQLGFRTLVVGHNLDDEAGRMLGNLLRHRSQYFAKQYPYLPSTPPRLPAKIKPLYRLESSEISIFCQASGIVPVARKCPFARGATSHAFKAALDLLETKMPGTKRDFLFSYLDRRGPPAPESAGTHCTRCGEPSYGDLCSVCNLLQQAADYRARKAPAD